jgi:ubiquinone/menaquinone biosynthesis C-methylase UbiE
MDVAFALMSVQRVACGWFVETDRRSRRGCAIRKVIEEYISNLEFQTYFEKLNGLRLRIARDLSLKPDMRILDLATGSGFFAIEVAKLDRTLRITGIDISQSDIRNARKNIKRQGLNDRVEILDMDATKMRFHPEEFDMAINFTGLEDIHMTRGRAGVEKTFLEVNRVLKPKSFFCFVAMPPEEMETEAQKIEVALFSYICDATWLAAEEYEEILQRANFRLIRKRSYYTGKKLTPEQAKAEIRFACKTDPKIYGISTPPFEEIWAKFGRDIEKNGLGYYSKVLLFIAQKVGKVR